MNNINNNIDKDYSHFAIFQDDFYEGIITIVRLTGTIAVSQFSRIYIT